VVVIGEYLTATENLEGPNTPTKLKAYNLELGYKFDMNGMPSTAAVSYQRTSDGELYDLPEKRVAATVSVEVLEKTTMGVEWKRETFYDGSDDNTATLQVAADF